MTPDELETYVLEAPDAWDLQRACAPLDEAQRAKLSTAAQRLHNQLYRSKLDKGASAALVRYFRVRRTGGDPWTYWNAEETRRARLALFALGPVSALKKNEIVLWDQERPIFEQIILDRRPPWIDDWIAFDLGRDWPQLDFTTLRTWIGNGVCAKPEVDGYYTKFAAHLMRTRENRQGAPRPPLLSQQLLDDPALLDDIPHLFRVESLAFNTNSWLQPEEKQAYETWPDALVKLAEQGHVRRERLFEDILEGLTRDLKQNQLSGFHGLYRRLGPDDAELMRHQQSYIGLMCHPVGHVVKFAIDMLSEVEKRGGLDTDAVLREAPAVLASGGKGNATAALKLIKRILARRKDDAVALSAVAEALRHAHADVQAQALDILEANTARLDADVRAALQDTLPFVAASHRKRLAALAGADPPEARGPAAAEPREPAGPWGATPDSSYLPLGPDLDGQTVLRPEDEILPIATTDELLGAILHAIEVVDSPDEVERIIDGISRLPGPTDERAAPALHRLEHPGGSTQGLITNFADVGGALLDLIFTWLTGRHHLSPRERSHYVEQVDAFEPFVAHLREISQRVAHRAQPLLAAPTHRGGWIDPLVWVERLRGQAAAIDTVDFRLSLLRLAPDNRRAALETAARLPTPLRRIATFALGGEAAPERGDRPSHAAWITAARCREPHRDWTDVFAPLSLDDPWPGGVRPARYAWVASHEKGQHAHMRWKTPKFTLRVAADGPPPTVQGGGVLGRIGQVLGGRIQTEWTALPTAAANRRLEPKNYWSEDLNRPWMAQWLLFVWPQDPAAVYMKAASRLALRIDDTGSGWTPNHPYFNGLFQSGRPWREAGHLLLGLGLMGRDADSKGLAVDALIDGITGRLFDPALFAATMTRLAEGGWMKLQRLGDSLSLVIAVSEQHAAVVGEALQLWLPTLDLQQNGVFRLLEVLVEVQALAGISLTPEAQAALRKASGAGKAAKMARQLLAA